MIVIARCHLSRWTPKGLRILLRPTGQMRASYRCLSLSCRVSGRADVFLPSFTARPGPQRRGDE